ncbi:MAG: iron chelate uptake ABC transporter family permease subunit [Clostridiales bacterium]|nr:iron chelate uptake ABC transporter family permease subunit [Clostridiales bacterium]
MQKQTRKNITGAESSQPQSYKTNKVWTKPFIFAIIFVVILGIISLFTGVYDIFGQEDGMRMFFITRIPRTVSLMLTGAAMSMSGLVMQLITQNRLVESTTTGTIEWAGLGLVFVYMLFPAPSLVLRMTGAIVFSFVGTMIFFLFLRKIKLRSSLIVPIIGMMLGAVISAISTFIGLVFQMTQNIETWFVGSFASVQIGRYEYLWLIVIVTIIIFIFADRLTLAGLGEDIATSLGVNYNRIVLLGTGLISFAVGIVAAVIGNLPFLGLIVPNIVSMYRGDDLRSNLPWVCLLGMGTITLCDIISRTIIMPFEVPVSLILGTVGSVVFIIILLKQRRLR